MKKHPRLFLILVLVLLGAGAWFVFPQESRSVCQAVSSFCKSAFAETKNVWERFFPPKEETVAKKADQSDGGNVAAAANATNATAAANTTTVTNAKAVANTKAVANATTVTNATAVANTKAAANIKAAAGALAIPTELGAIADPSSDPEPSSLTSEQRKRRYAELVAAADKRKREVMFAGLKKCPEGMAALKATRAYRAKVDEMKKLESQYGPSDTRVTGLRVELTRLKDATRTANARYKAWKDAHPEEVVDPMADKLYCDLISRSRFYKD